MTRTRLFIVATIAVAFLWCFGSVLFRDRSFGFRDAANYYYPLFEWECGEWRTGRLPLWNPLDNGGTPVLADTTSSVLYPGKILFVLPVSYRLRYHLYVTAHILLAAGMAYRLARHWRYSLEGSGLAAISYAFGGSVLFQYCNVVFLVGAAWLPFGLIAADRMLRERRVGWALALGATLALMVLGGDPQAAYHTGMISALYAVLLRYDRAASSIRIPTTWRNSRPALLATAASAGVCLSLVQILPATEWTRQSSRDASDTPRNAYETVAALWSGQPSEQQEYGSGILSNPKPGTHLSHVYEFSIGPWHLAEFVWPNFFGRLFPRNERWSTAFPGEGRTWTPSLYVGLLPFFLAICSWRVRRCDARVRFLSLVTLIALLASFGWYGIGWLLHELRASLLNEPPETSGIGAPVGGVYWLFVTLLPGYVYFRYPAKLLVIASLGISMLAARGWDKLLVKRTRHIALLFVILSATSLFAAAMFGVLQTPWKSWLSSASADTIFGPLDIAAATNGVLAAFLHTAILGLAYWCLLRSPNAILSRSRGVLLLGITALELCWANGWMTHSIPGHIWSARQPLAEAICAESTTLTPPRLYRDSSAALLPKAWSQTGDDDRLADVVAWERATLLPKHHLPSGIAIIGSHTTLTSADWQSFLRVARQWDRAHVPEQHGSLLDSMSAVRIATGTASTPKDADIDVVLNPRAFPRAWITHEIEVLQPLRDHTLAAIEQRTREVFIDNRRLRDLRTVSILETAVPQRLPVFEKASKAKRSDLCEISYYSTQHIEIDVNLSEPGCLMLCDSFDQGWQAERITGGISTDLAIYRANRLMRAVILPAGTHRVVYRYRPPTFVLGAWISGIAWMLVIVGAILRLLRAKDTTNAT
ncbi:MAG: hypothetical protein KDB05_03345 [Planctomycetales bacterium]|nr:hypothetical protein [Planctomycetales bacterium]